MKKNAIAAAVALVGALSASTASAIPITWNLSANLADPSGALQTLTGTFVYNADDVLSATLGYSNVNVLNSGAPGFPSVTESIVVPTFTFASQLTATSALAIGAPAFFISFVSNLTNAGGTIAIGGIGFPGLGLCADAVCGGFNTTFAVTGGEITTQPVTSVPEPATSALLLCGLGATVGAARRKNAIRRA